MKLYLHLDRQQVRDRHEGIYENLILRHKDYSYVSLLKIGKDWEKEFPDFVEFFLREILGEKKHHDSTEKFYADVKKEMKEILPRLRDKGHVTLVIAYDPDWNTKKEFLYLNWMERKV